MTKKTETKAQKKETPAFVLPKATTEAARALARALNAEDKATANRGAACINLVDAILADGVDLSDKAHREATRKQIEKGYDNPNSIKGILSKVKKISAYCVENKLKTVEDAAEALGVNPLFEPVYRAIYRAAQAEKGEAPAKRAAKTPQGKAAESGLTTRDRNTVAALEAALSSGSPNGIIAVIKTLYEGLDAANRAKAIEALAKVK